MLEKMKRNKVPLTFGIKKRRTASDVDGRYNQNDSKIPGQWRIIIVKCSTISFKNKVGFWKEKIETGEEDIVEDN